MKSESFRKQALSLVLFFAAVAAVFALTRLRSDPAKKQAEFVVQQLLSCSSAVEQAVDAAAPAGSEPGLAAVDTDGLYAFLQAQLGDAMTADCLDKVMANRLPTRITALAGQSGDKLTPADLTLKKHAGAENCYDFSAALLTAADSTAAAQVSGTITMVKEDGRWKASAITLNLEQPLLPPSRTARGHFLLIMYIFLRARMLYLDVVSHYYQEKVLSYHE